MQYQNNKLKLALAVAAIGLPVAAQADATIYGFISGGVESAKATGNGSAEYKSTTRVVDNNSRIGFKGNEDLGNGLKAIWQVESSLRNFEQGGTNDKGQNAVLATRNTFVGLQDSRWGTFQLGNYDSAYKRLTDVGLNVLGDTVADQTGGNGVVYSRRYARLANSVHYTSPVWSGVQLGVSYGLDEIRPTASNGTRQNDDRLDLAASYTIGGLQLGIGYDREGDKLNATSSADAQQHVDGYKLAASYLFASSRTLIGAGFERVKIRNNGSSDTRQNDWLIALSQPLIGALTLKAGYAMLGKLDGAGSPDDFKAKQWLAGVTYDLSKRTQLYAYGTRIHNNSQQNANFPNNPVFSSGMGTSAAALAKGDNPQAIGIGMKTAF
ncbi:porin [Neisseriaceae bacterium JH1-16]|nr:porin [Neisseriaceae bacterium JH1-16]